jgi:succinoglycan biosynthesis transport protein ExoP
MPNSAAASSPNTRFLSVDRFLPQEGDEPREQTGFSIGIADMRLMAWRQRYLIGTIVGMAVLLAVIVTLLMTPIFRAQSTLRIDQENAKIIEGQDVDPAVAISDTARYMNTQKGVILSRGMAYRVVDTLHLGNDDAFFKAMRVNLPSSKIPANELPLVRRNLAATIVQSHVAADVPIDSRITTISFSSPDPVVAARLANTYADIYVDQNSARRYESTAYARRYLQSEIERARAKLQEAEHAAITYAQQAQIIDARDAAAAPEGGQGGGAGGSSSSLTTANLVRLNSDYSAAHSARIAAEERWKVAARTSPMELPEVIANAAIQNLRADRARMQSQLLQLRQRYESGHPQVAELTAQIGSLDKQIRQIAVQTRDSLRTNYLAARAQEASLQSAMQGLRGVALNEQNRRVQLNLIARDAETSRRQLDNLLQRYNQVSAAADIRTNNVSVVDRAEVPTSPVSPRAFFNVAAALALGFALALVLAFIREALDDTVRSPEDVERKLDLPLIGTTPLVTDETTTVALSDDRHPLSEAYYSVRATLDFASPNGAPKTLLVTSSSPGEGKSTTSAAIGLDYARIGKKTLLIDADLRKPSLHKLFGVKNDAGFVNLLTGQSRIDEVVLTVPGSTLHFLTLGPIPVNPAQLLSSDALPRFLERFSKDYDVIVFDAAPVMGIADVPLIARFMEGTLVIVEANRAHRGQAKTALKRLVGAGANVLGVVLTKFDARDAGYSYDYHYKYYSYGSPAKKRLISFRKPEVEEAKS